MHKLNEGKPGLTGAYFGCEHFVNPAFGEQLGPFSASV